MSLAQKFQEGGSTPTLYSFYGKQYDYNDLAQAADQGLNEYLASLKRGEKDSNDFRTAYANIMAGIKDGTITFDNGRFNDSQGRYTNSDKKNRDYYGLIANYIYGKMGKSDAYKIPDDPTKIKWDNDSIRKAVMRQIFNRDNGNIQDFLDLDAEKDGVRSIANRSTYLANALQAVADNWDNTFTGYQDSDKSNNIALLNAAAKAVRDGAIDAGDYLALSKAVDGMDFRSMFATGTPTTHQETTNPTGTEVGNTVNQEASNTPTNLSQRTVPNKYVSINLGTKLYAPNVMNRITFEMNRVPVSGLINILKQSFYNRNYRFGNDKRVQTMFGTSNIRTDVGVTATLMALYNKGELKNADPSYPSIFYIPGLTSNDGTTWIWDKNTNQVAQVRSSSIPALAVAMHKQGGILYAQAGTSFNNIWGGEGADIGYDTYLNKIYNNADVLNWMKSKYSGTDALKNYENYVKNNVDQRSQYGINDYNNSAKYTANEGVRTFNTGYQNAGDTLNYTLFGNNLEDYNNKKGVVYSLTSFNRPNKSKGTGDSYNTDASKAYIDDALGLQTYSRVASLTDKNLKTGGFGEWGNYWKGNGATGAYYYVNPNDKSGRGQWIPTNDKTLSNYQDFETTQPTQTTQPESPKQTQNSTQGSKIDLTQQKNKPKANLFNKETLQNIAPYAVGLGRVFDSVRTNNKIAKEVGKTLKPVLKDTYELYSPVTGAFSEMQLRNRQASDIRRQAAQPYTSDASLNAARSLEANKQATDLEYNGFLADDKEIQRTKQEALKRQEDNIARRTNVTNDNRAAINASNREKAMLEAQRLGKNWQSRDNFLADIESNLKERAEYNKSTKRTINKQTKINKFNLDLASITNQQNLQREQLSDYYNNKINQNYREFATKLADWKKVNGAANTAFTNEPFYQDYIKNEAKIKADFRKDQYELGTYHSNSLRKVYDEVVNGIYSAPQQSQDSIENSNWWKIINGKISARRGGKLRLTTQYLLKKVMQ